MDKKYKNLMEQQNIRDEVNAQFSEALEKSKTRCKSVRWKAAFAAACVALMIPLTVLAVENIFGSPKVKIGKLDWHDSPNGYSIHFENLDNFPLDAFPESEHTLTKHKFVSCESWEAAEETLGIDLLNNAFLSNASRNVMSFSDLGNVHSVIMYAQHEGMLYYVNTAAYYRYNGLQLDLKAKITVDHPTLDEESKQLLHGIEGVFNEPDDVKISCEEYTTKEGIPVVILRCELEHIVQYCAVFAVNNISYEVSAWVNPGKEETEKQVLLDVLDGFQLK